MSKQERHRPSPGKGQIIEAERKARQQLGIASGQIEAHEMKRISTNEHGAVSPTPLKSTRRTGRSAILTSDGSWSIVMPSTFGYGLAEVVHRDAASPCGLSAKNMSCAATRIVPVSSLFRDERAEHIVTGMRGIRSDFTFRPPLRQGIGQTEISVRVGCVRDLAVLGIWRL